MAHHSTELGRLARLLNEKCKIFYVKYVKYFENIININKIKYYHPSS